MEKFAFKSHVQWMDANRLKVCDIKFEFRILRHLDVLIGLQCLFSLPGCCACVLLLFLIFNDFCQTNYLNPCRTDLR